MDSNFTPQEIQTLSELQQKYSRMKIELNKKIVGHSEILDRCLIAIFSGGHCLLVGVPGLGKTLLVQSLASLLSMKFSRIQFTPDLMPSDIVGTQVIAVDAETKEKRFKFLRGPIFANLFLADEINRTPPKTQAALMEAMEEKQVSLGGEKTPLPKPFFTMATQNFVEQEGIYPLPFAQLDRFMFQLRLEYPSVEEEYKIIELTTSSYTSSLEPILTREEIVQFIQMVRRISISDELIQYAIKLGRATRPSDPLAPPFVSQWIQCGASPRGPYYTILASKAWALLNGRTKVEVKDIAYVAPAVLEHRIILSYHAQIERLSPSELLSKILKAIPEPGKKKGTFFSFLFGRAQTA